MVKRCVSVADNPGLVPSNAMGAHRHPYLQLQGEPKLSSDLRHQACMWCVSEYAGKIYIHIK